MRGSLKNWLSQLVCKFITLSLFQKPRLWWHCSAVEQFGYERTGRWSEAGYEDSIQYAEKRGFFRRDSGDPRAPRQKRSIPEQRKRTYWYSGIHMRCIPDKQDRHGGSFGSLLLFCVRAEGNFAYNFPRISKIQPLFCRLGVLPRKHREKSYPQKLSIPHCIYCLGMV